MEGLCISMQGSDSVAQFNCRQRLTSPGRDQTANVTHHNVSTDTSGSRGIGKQIGSYLSVGHGSEGESARCDKEGGLYCASAFTGLMAETPLLPLTPYLTVPLVVARNMI